MRIHLLTDSARSEPTSVLGKAVLSVCLVCLSCLSVCVYIMHHYNGIWGTCASSICTTKAQCAPWCTRETIFFEKIQGTLMIYGAQGRLYFFKNSGDPDDFLFWCVCLSVCDILFTYKGKKDITQRHGMRGAPWGMILRHMTYTTVWVFSVGEMSYRENNNWSLLTDVCQWQSVIYILTSGYYTSLRAHGIV